MIKKIYIAGPLFNKHEQMYLEDIYTVLANLTGCPAISVPSKNLSNNMPHAFQLIAKNFEEEKLLSFSKAYL